MVRHKEVRKYRKSDATLTQLSDSIQHSALRDADALAHYGVSADDIAQLQATRDAFANSPTDTELSTDLVIATQAKNAERQIMLEHIRQITERVRIKYGAQDGQYRLFGADLLTRQTDDELLRTARRTIYRATALLPSLSTEGLSPAMITALDTSLHTFDHLIDQQREAISNRDLAVDQRISLGNQLYKQLLKLAAKGKLCWGAINEAKYNDYILTLRGPKQPHSTEGTIAPSSVVATSVSGLKAATSLTLRNTGMVPLQFFFAPNPTDTHSPMQQLVPPNSSSTCTAHLIGYAAKCKRLNVYNPEASAGSYGIDWD